MNEIEDFEPFDESIRKVWDDSTQRYWFAIVDVVEILAEPSRVTEYWRKMKVRDFAELTPFWCEFKLKHKSNGRMYNTDCADMQGILRIIQSIPSPNAEPFKQWLATVGHERIEEAADPSKAIDRAREIYKQHGYSDAWINRRLDSKRVRDTLIAHWNDSGVEDENFYELLNVISDETFGVTRDKHKQIKGLEDEALEDHMTDVELALTITGDVFAKEIAQTNNLSGLEGNKEAARRGGQIAGNTRKQLEAQTGKSAISPGNYLTEPEKEVRQKLEKKNDAS